MTADRITVSEIARLLGVDERTVRRMLAAGEIPGARAGSRGHWIVPREAFEEWWERRMGARA